jgi:hypothetical protein
MIAINTLSALGTVKMTLCISKIMFASQDDQIELFVVDNIHHRGFTMSEPFLILLSSS